MLSMESKELDRALLECMLDNCNFGIDFVAVISWHGPSTFLTLFGRLF
jgi:hypothetical protein